MFEYCQCLTFQNIIVLNYTKTFMIMGLHSNGDVEFEKKLYGVVDNFTLITTSLFQKITTWLIDSLILRFLQLGVVSVCTWNALGQRIF